MALKEVVADLTLENRVLKNHCRTSCARTLRLTSRVCVCMRGRCCPWVTCEDKLSVRRRSRFAGPTHEVRRRSGTGGYPLPRPAADAKLMWEGMAIQPLRSIPEYRSLVESVGLRVISTKDLTEEWGSTAASSTLGYS